MLRSIIQSLLQLVDPFERFVLVRVQVEQTRVQHPYHSTRSAQIVHVTCEQLEILAHKVEIGQRDVIADRSKEEDATFDLESCDRRFDVGWGGLCRCCWAQVEEDVGAEGFGRRGCDGFSVLGDIVCKSDDTDTSSLSGRKGGLPGVELGLITAEPDYVTCAQSESKFDRGIS